MLDHHRRVLATLAEYTVPDGEACIGLKRLTEFSGLQYLSEVRRITRHLARKGYAQYWRGLTTDDGELAGAGYCITAEGRAALEQGRA